jgi:hypothetical protein
MKGYGFLLILVVGSNMDGTRWLPTHNDGQYQRCGGAIGDLTGKEKKRATGSELRWGWHLNVHLKTRNLPRGSTGGGGDLSRARDRGLLFFKPGDGEATPLVLLRLLLLLPQ